MGDSRIWPRYLPELFVEALDASLAMTMCIPQLKFGLYEDDFSRAIFLGVGSKARKYEDAAHEVVKCMFELKWEILVSSSEYFDALAKQVAIDWESLDRSDRPFAEHFGLITRSQQIGTDSSESD